VFNVELYSRKSHVEPELFHTSSCGYEWLGVVDCDAGVYEHIGLEQS
jgi:hypothetical protein